MPNFVELERYELDVAALRDQLELCEEGRLGLSRELATTHRLVVELRVAVLFVRAACRSMMSPQQWDAFVAEFRAGALGVMDTVDQRQSEQPSDEIPY